MRDVEVIRGHKAERNGGTFLFVQTPAERLTDRISWHIYFCHGHTVLYDAEGCAFPIET